MVKTILFVLMATGLAIFSWPQTTTCTNMAVVTVTAYHPGVRAAGSRPGITASGLRVEEGMIALSADIENCLNMNFGDKVKLEGLGVYQFQDRMARRCRQKVDIFMTTRHEAIQFGKKRNVLLLKVV